MNLNFKIKIVLAMAGLILVVSFFSLALSRRAVRTNFENLLERQFSELAGNFSKARGARVATLSEFLADATTNPRITAAFGVGVHDQYERFYFDLSVEMEEIVNRFSSSTADWKPFFRFIDWEGRYLQPPAATMDNPDVTGLETPFPEASIRALFLSHTSVETSERSPRSGYDVIEVADRVHPLEVLVVPTYDSAGYEMGDLVFARPLDTQDFAVPGSGAYLALQIGPHLFSSGISPLAEETLETYLGDAAYAANRDRRRLALDRTPYAVFNQRIQSTGDFPRSSQVYLFSLREEQEILADIQSALFAVTAIALILGLALSLLAAQRLSRRVRGLVTATLEIARGNFGYQVPVSGGDEISQLGDAFNQMSVDLAQKEKFRSVLEKVTDREVAAQLTTGSLVLGGEERTATILFCDIRRFTPLTRSKTAPEVVDLLNQHMTALTTVVHKHHGVVDKFVGDEIMALFGVPRSFGNDAENAIRCAREMLELRERMNREAETPVEIGIGAATGSVVAGCMGSESRLNYTVIGNCVNLASRLCGSAVGGQVLFDLETAESLGSMRTVSCEPIQLKGFTHRIPVFTLERDQVSSAS